MNVLMLSKLLVERRGERGVREFARIIGISPATLSRVERVMLPDLDTFTKVCAYLKLDPAEVLEIDRVPPVAAPKNRTAPVPVMHFRADAQMSSDAAKDFAELILAAQKFALARA